MLYFPIGFVCADFHSDNSDSVINVSPGSFEEIYSSTRNSDSYDHLPDHPIQLIRPDPLQHRKLETIERNIQYLHHINTTVAVIAVVGKFHSGKSFLLNQLMGKQEGFGIGPSVRPQTMGIWMWGKVRNVFANIAIKMEIAMGVGSHLKSTSAQLSSQDSNSKLHEAN